AEHKTSRLLAESNVLPAFARLLQSSPLSTVKTTQVLAEIAKNEEMKAPCIDAGLVPVLIPLLSSTDQEILLYTGRCQFHNTQKLQLAEAGIQDAIVEILQRLQDCSKPEDICSLKAASDLMVSLLLGDESMQQLFADGNGIIFQNTGTWLASKHTQLQLTGALAIANFARNDSNCIRMVQLGTVHQLLDLLEQHVENGDVSVQHAALSALRNLAIPVANKVQMLKEGVAKRIQMLLRSELPPVQFKLLGTLRMLMDGQADAAEELGQDPILLSRLVQWCDSKDHAGVCGEANRLLASFLRHSCSQEVVKAIQEAQAVKHLVSMTTSEHVIMQNEALIALAIASAINLESYKETKLIHNIHTLLQNESIGPEVKYNSIGLLCSLLNSGNISVQWI
uniref:Uncharacterized protein n=1 Tax=Salvator merianae TaxID=96440 RepID=A0A8D0BNC8_SALMN